MTTAGHEARQPAAGNRTIQRAHQWRRGDGTVLSCRDLNEAVPMMLDELDDIVRLVDPVEEWLLLDEPPSTSSPNGWTRPTT
jgi:hypothetical protein